MTDQNKSALQIAISKGMKIHWAKRKRQAIEAAPKKRRSKYNAQRCVIDGEKFHSIAEGKRWLVLRQDERDGKIVGLTRQRPFPLHAPSKDLLGKYVADFSYFDCETNRSTVEDYKGFDTPLAKWKRRHAEAQYGIEILLTGPAAKKRRRK